jgi:hypothetical protein
MRGLTTGTLAVWSVMELMLDRWRLAHSDAPVQRERQLRLRCVVSLIAVMLAAVFLLL